MMQDPQRTLELFYQQLNSLVQAKGFKAAGRREWHRAYHWKTDVVLIDIKGGTSPALLCSFRISIPELRQGHYNEDSLQFLAYDNVPRILNMPNKYRQIPIFFPKRFIEKVIHEVDEALVWFDKYYTPEMVLLKLETLFDRRSEAYKNVEKYLRNIIENSL